MFTKLTKEQLQQKVDFISHYIGANNAADGSLMDANANVSTKNVATMANEINKDINIQINRTLVCAALDKMFEPGLSDEYLRQIQDHEIYVHDETSLLPYCVSVSMYPLLIDGLTSLGGESKAPKHLESFCGSFVNFVFAASSQFAGAVATVEFLMYFDYFAKKDYGDDYLTTHTREVCNHLQHVVYAINQPAAARGYQSVFLNISLYDQPYFESMFGDFAFPDESFTRPVWSSLERLQMFFVDWFTKEREKAVLTFPVVTAAMLVKDGEPVDKKFAKDCADAMSRGSTFFIYMSANADSLASCCRLRNEMSDNTFSYTLGAGGVSTGSIKVITLNVNRLIQSGKDIGEEIDKVHKYQVAYRSIIQQYKEAGMLPIYDAGFISLDKQYLTIGINGLVEAAESQGVDISVNDDYKQFVDSFLKIIFDKNKEAKLKYGFMFNTEFVPAESLGVKNANWDKKDGYAVTRDCYNSYFYAVEDESLTPVDKFILHGSEFTQYLDGGSALHLNLNEHLTSEAYLKLFDVAAQTGCNYWCVNVKSTVCNDCGFIDKRTLNECSQCHSTDVDYATRIIGYLKKISSFSSSRKAEEGRRNYHLN